MNKVNPVNTAIVLVAAGMGTRLGAGIPKALVEVQGSSLLQHCLERVCQLSALGQIVVVLPAEDAILRAQAEEFGSKVHCVSGGASRAASVAAGLAVVEPGMEKVLVHDVARAFTPHEVYLRVLQALDEATVQAVIPVLPVTDTICVVDSNCASGQEQVLHTPPRNSLRAVQTPQGFDARVIRLAHAQLGDAHEEQLEMVTDDASLVQQAGYPIYTVPGHAAAMKVTHRQDLQTADRILAESAADHELQKENHMRQLLVPRVGNAIDVHTFSDDPQRPLWLAGLHFSAETGLAGHSDGDAVAHAACDALFSAAGIGDLGTHFGVDRPEFAGASGVKLLGEAARIVRTAGFEIGNVAVQFVGSRPRFAARREEANDVLSAAAAASVTVTATTSDGLGYEGAGAGITAYATALVYPRA